MSDFMNAPVVYDWSDSDVVAEYECCHDKKAVAKIWNISIKEVNEILERNGWKK